MIVGDARGVWCPGRCRFQVHPRVRMRAREQHHATIRVPIGELSAYLVSVVLDRLYGLELLKKLRYISAMLYRFAEESFAARKYSSRSACSTGIYQRRILF